MNLRHLVACGLVLLFSGASHAAPERNACVDLYVPGTTTPLINGATMESTRSFAVDRPNTEGGYGLLSLWIDLTDANTSITRFDVACTVSRDGNAKDYTPQECTSSGGIYTCVDTGVWRKSSPGTKAWPLRLDVEGFPDFECSFAVGAGSGASADLLTVHARLCTK